VNIIHDSSKNLLALLNDILDLSKIETGKMYVAKRNCNLQELLDSIGTMFGNSSQARELDFRIIPCAPLPPVIHADPMRIQQCLVNLIGNALKFTHQGHVYVRILFEENHLKFEVEDTGVGIPQALHEVIFEAFAQADDSTGRDYGGNGLGLTITRQLARLMGGDVILKSEVGQGSTFTLDIPVNMSNTDTQQTFQDAGIADHETGV
jgi:two-component system chemotaxis sensor kinase CheA